MELMIVKSDVCGTPERVLLERLQFAPMKLKFCFCYVILYVGQSNYTRVYFNSLSYELQRSSINFATHSVPPTLKCVAKQGRLMCFALRVVVVAVTRATTVVCPTSGVVGLKLGGSSIKDNTSCPRQYCSGVVRSLCCHQLNVSNTFLFQFRRIIEILM